MLAGCRERDLMRCHFGREAEVAKTRGMAFHAVRHLGDAVLWSADEGLFVRRGEGAEPERLGPPCDGGLDATSAGEALVVACARPGEPDEAKPGGLVAWVLRAGEATERSLLDGRVGPESDGLALAWTGDEIWLAWHDGTPGDFRVWRSTLRLVNGRLTERSQPEAVSDPARGAGAPSYHVDEGRRVLTWAEHWADATAYHRSRGHVVVSVDGGTPRPLIEVEHPEPAPTIGRDSAGLLLLFRDDREPLEHPSLFAHRLTSDVRLHGGLRLIGRADERGPIRTFGCTIDGALTQVAVVARSWGAEDALVAAHLLDDELTERYHELQVYEWGGQLALGDGSCEDNSLDLLIAERAVPPTPGATLFTIPARCAAGAFPR